MCLAQKKQSQRCTKCGSCRGKVWWNIQWVIVSRRAEESKGHYVTLAFSTPFARSQMISTDVILKSLMKYGVLDGLSGEALIDIEGSKLI